ncbi:MAG TPA: ATP-dependent DNA ligase, partial [Pseudolabrys sp.]|nr:ATP-dependent DNA ligase [Pseudolabrys sp.]
MEALSVDEIPSGKEWQYEPKWDGFRTILRRNGSRIELQSKSGQSLTRYYPELIAAARAIKARQFALDGEIVVPTGKAFSFDDLLQRIHPAASRVAKLSKETPAVLIVFDLLADETGKPLVKLPLEQRRVALERFAKTYLRGHKSF